MRALALSVALLLAPAAAALAAAPGPLPPLCIDPKGVTVSGISSGGFLAHQLHVAHSRRIAGAAIFAAGPYLCAGDGYPESLFRALNVCADFSPGPFLGPPDVERSLNAARTAAKAGRIDDLAGLRGDRVFLFSGGRDDMVPTPVVDAVESVYRALLDPADIAYVKRPDAAHGMVTTAFGAPCGEAKAPFLNACGYDLAGAALEHLYGRLDPPRPAGAPAAFDQRLFAPAGRTHGLAETGFIYIPDSCRKGAGCRLHVALHGCQQNAETIGDAFTTQAGYNGWAEANGIVVLYPQAAPVGRAIAGFRAGSNPQACWDWWGFTGPDFAFRTGAQIGAIMAMVERLGMCEGNDRETGG